MAPKHYRNDIQLHVVHPCGPTEDDAPVAGQGLWLKQLDAADTAEEAKVKLPPRKRAPTSVRLRVGIDVTVDRQSGGVGDIILVICGTLNGWLIIGEIACQVTATDACK